MVFPIMAVAAIGMVGMSLLGSLTSKKSKVDLPPAVKADIEKLNYVPFGPERDALVKDITETYGISSDQLNQSLNEMNGVLNTNQAQNAQNTNNLQGISNQLTANAGNNAYQQYYGNPAEREQSYLASAQAANAAAFDPYGQQGAESQLRKGLLSADAARKGLVNSGIARRQMEQENMRMAAARSEADNKAIASARQQGVNEGQIYNQAAGQATQNLNSAANAQTSIAQINQGNVTNRMNAAKLYGDTAYQTSAQLGNAQSEARNGQQAVANYNTEVANKVNQDYASAQNQRNAQQAGIDMSYTKPNVFNSISNAIGAGMSIYGMGGAGGAAGAAGGAAAGGAASSAGGGWNPQMPSSNYSTYSRYGSSY